MDSFQRFARMANENKNIKELVSDDKDQTAELETPTWREQYLEASSEELIESDAITFDAERYAPLPQDANTEIEVLKTDLRSRIETIDRLQFDVERLRSRRTGLETEVRAREAQTLKLAEALDMSTSQIEALNAALRQIEQSNRKLSNQLHTVQRKHAEEIRTLRFELTAAEDTMQILVMFLPPVAFILLAAAVTDRMVPRRLSWTIKSMYESMSSIQVSPS